MKTHRRIGLPGTSTRSLTRRGILKGGASLAGALALPALPLLSSAAHAAPLDALEIWGPPAGPSITVLHAIATGRLDKAATKASLRVWRQVDEVRAGLTSKRLDVAIMPVPVAANLYDRGLGVRLVNVMTNGILYIMSADPEMTSLATLKGRRLAVMAPNELPNLILQRLFKHAGMDGAKDVELVPTGTPLESIQLLVLGRVDAALAPEPAASAAVVRGKLAGKTIHRVMDIQAEWARLTGAEPILPQAGLAVTDAFRTAHPDAVEALQAGLQRAAADVNAYPARAASNAAGPLQLPWPVIEQSIPFSHLVATAARDARTHVETVLEAMAVVNPGYIGGRLPDGDFYL